MTPRYRGVAPGDHRRRGGARARVARVPRPTLHEVPLGPGARALLVDCPELYDRRRHLQRGRLGLSRQRPSLRVSVGRSHRLGVATIEAARHSSCPRLAERPACACRYSRQARRHRRHPRHLRCPGTVFTIHNLAYQGAVRQDMGAAARPGVGRTSRSAVRVLRSAQLSEGRAQPCSMRITTVSPTYAEEIQRPEYGDGLDGVIRARRDALSGILNGIDTDEWNPATRPVPAGAVRCRSPRSARAASKRALLETFGLPVTDETHWRGRWSGWCRAWSIRKASI